MSQLREQLGWLEGSCVVISFFLLSFPADVVGLVVVVVTSEARAEPTRAVFTTRIELFGEKPLLVKSAVVWKLG